MLSLSRKSGCFGGYVNRFTRSNVVEAYDHILDEWVEMPSMINARSNHSQVATRNKLYIVGRESCEMFDSDKQRFVLINKPIRSFSSLFRSFEAISIGNKIVVYHYKAQTCSFYDIKKDEWSEEDFELTKNLSHFSCVKVPQFITYQKH